MYPLREAGVSPAGHVPIFAHVPSLEVRMQNLAAVLLALLVAASLVGAFGLKGGSLLRRSPGERPGSERLKSMSQREVEKLLARVQSSAVPEELEGAMCYAVMPYTDSAEYLCPVCGEKTVYGSDDSWLVSRQIPAARRYMEQITAEADLEIRLDERGFCSFCSGSGESQALVLRVVYEEGDTVSSEVTDFDLQLLAGLFSNQLFYTTSNDGRMPLLPYLDRMRQVLGLPAGSD
jgi:predicted RNA-binding Zn-ribbon protein involved in translation (DUF1610 family)